MGFLCIFKVGLGRQIGCEERKKISESRVTASDSFICHCLPQKRPFPCPPFFVNPECFGKSDQKHAFLATQKL